MADLSHQTDGPSPLSREGYDESLLPDFNHDFISEEDLQAFATALAAPDPSPSTDDLRSPSPSSLKSPSFTNLDGARSKPGSGFPSQSNLFITAQNDWAPVTPTKLRKHKEKKKKRRRKQHRSRDETREGYFYTLLKWPLLGIVGAWVLGLGASYMLTRLYVWLYGMLWIVCVGSTLLMRSLEYFIAWRGKRNRLRTKLHATTNYGDWVQEAQELDAFLGNDQWKAEDEYAYYDHKTVKRVLDQIRKCRRTIEQENRRRALGSGPVGESRAVEDLKTLIEACVRNNFVGVENSRLYSQTYYGTKSLVQNFIDEGAFIMPLDFGTAD